MKKADTLHHWKGLEKRNPLAKMTPIAYKARGSRYGACGIRIDGNPEFVDAVLSCLKELIAGENHMTRLELARSVVDGSGIGKVLENADHTGAPAEVCYIRLHMRGREAQMVGVYFDKHLAPATKEYANALGLTD